MVSIILPKKLDEKLTEKAEQTGYLPEELAVRGNPLPRSLRRKGLLHTSGLL
jgi:hypothetical protein